jgi:hypothetical protein
MHDHDDFAGEPIRGLPAVPPEDEAILWQGSPAWKSLALGAFFVRPVAFYFLILMVWSLGADLTAGAPLPAALLHAASLLLPAAIAIGLLAAVAYASARSTVYTITSKRVVLRIGMALTVTINVPFKQIKAASLRPRSGGTGDICLELSREARIGYTTLWPHVRAWRINFPQPALRSLPDAVAVARLLTDAVSRTAPVKRGAADGVQNGAVGKPSIAASAAA